MFRKGNIFVGFLFAFWENTVVLKVESTQSKEFTPRGANSFLLELIFIEKGGCNDSGRVASLKVCHLKVYG